MAEVKQQFALKRIQANQHVQQLKEQLERERRTKQMAELSLAAFNKQIEQERIEIKKIHEAPVAPPAPDPSILKKAPLPTVPEKPLPSPDKSPPKKKPRSPKRQ